MKQYQIAIVGYGGMGHWHNNGIRQTDRVAFCGVYDINPERMKLAQQEGIPTAYESFEAVLADEKVDAVLIATPNNFHKDLACRAMEAGKFFICEKPVAMSSAELQEMMDCSKKTGVPFTIHQNRRADADFLRVRDTIEKGLLGDVFEIESRVTGSRGIPEGWRQYAVAGGGMMLDWGVHLIDQLLYMIPRPVVSLTCELYHVAYKECDDGFRLTMRFEDGPTAMVEVGTSHYLEAPRWLVYGDRGALTIPDWSFNGKIIRAKEHVVTFEEEIIYTKAGPTKTMAPRAKDTLEEISFSGDGVETDYDVYYRDLAAYFDGKGELKVKPEEAMRVMKVMEAAFESDRTGETIHGRF